ncbi:hypothetical protein [Salinispora arenicola]|uniref:hypothetical protein n=1 Tax=Salinispora arenicola TaxID=168697 RepID=UPI0016BA7C41|nr:hypothetical protein [Salinispora arenicola]NIL64717.1 hypothetical protein [Salinispora arenicola]
MPSNAESWLLGRLFRLAADQGIRGLVAFSDPMPRILAGELLMPGHVGHVYRVTRGRYLGRGTARTITILPDGTVLTDRAAQKVRAGERGAAGVRARLVALRARPLPEYARAGIDLTPGEWLELALAQIGARRVRSSRLPTARLAGGGQGLAQALPDRPGRTALPARHRSGGDFVNPLRTEADLLRTLERGCYTLPELYRLDEQAGLADRADGRRIIQDGQAQYKRGCARRCSLQATGPRPPGGYRKSRLADRRLDHPAAAGAADLAARRPVARRAGARRGCHRVARGGRADRPYRR